MATIIDIAKKTQLSVGTISNYMNNPEVVSLSTQEKIKRAIDELGYHPRAAARTLKSKLTKQIGFVPTISPEENRNLHSSDNVLLDFIAAINTVLTENDYSLLLHGATSLSDELFIYRKLIGEKQVDGIVLMGTMVRDPRIELLLEKEFPFVAFGRAKTTKDYPFVDVDGEKGMSSATDYLIHLGHTRIGYISPPSIMMCAGSRLKGYSTALSDHGITADEDLIIEGGFTEEAGFIAMEALLSKPFLPTAVITANDLCAFGAMRALQSHGLEPGVDCSVVGFDNISLAAHWQPSLTTLTQPTRQIGFQVAGMVLDIINHKKNINRNLIAPELIVRQSTGPVRTIKKN